MTASSRTRRLIILAVLWAFAFTVLVVFRAVVLPFALSALIAYVMAPMVDWLSTRQVGRFQIPRWVSVLVVYLLFFCGLYLFSIALVPQLYRELVRISKEALEYINSLTPERIQGLARTAEDWLVQRGFPIALTQKGTPLEEPQGAFTWTVDVEQAIHQLAARSSLFLRENLGNIFAVSRTVLTTVFTSVFGLFLMLMLAAFLSIDIQTIRGYVRSLIPVHMAEDARRLSRQIDRSLAGVVRGQLIICLVNGMLTFLGLFVFDINFSLLLATVAATFSLIPIFGSILSSIPIVVIALAQSWHQALAILAWIVGIHALEAYFLNPKIMGSAAKIHPVVMVFALIAGERSYGLLGALLAPVVAAIVVACFEFARKKAQPHDELELT
jgi:predicted PurR-regulated permease PerM